VTGSDYASLAVDGMAHQSGHLFVVECATRVLSVVATDGAMVLHVELNVSHQTMWIPLVD
jgi:hypothetical protein